MEKVAEIKEFTTTFLKFKTVNSKGDTVNSQIGTNVVKRFVMYDDEDILQYDSRLDGAEHTNGSVRKNSKYPSTVSVSTHQLSINPFFIPFLVSIFANTYQIDEDEIFPYLCKVSLDGVTISFVSSNCFSIASITPLPPV